MDSSLERMEDLLVKRSLEGLSDREATELQALRAEFPHVDIAAFDRAVAAISVAGLPVAEEMPAGLYADIEAIGVQIAAENKTTNESAAPAKGAEVIDIRSPVTRDRREARRTGFVPWFVAAASVVVAVAAWWPGTQTQTGIDFAQRRESLILAGGRLEAWTATDDATAVGASGDVVWSSDGQEGYMRFVMLSANDPAVFQYQLWIFDAERDERFPVDGGVFDVPAGASEVIIPIRAGLPVGDATLFAITVERPGGVVVSDRERIALLADFG